MKPDCVVTIGSFDGVHRGHQALLARLRQEAVAGGRQSVVVTFDRQPREVLDPGFRPQLLTTTDEKRRLLLAQGIDRVEVLDFTRDLAALSAREFMASVLRDRLGAGVLLTGYDNRFGHGRTAGFDDYAGYGRELGIAVVRADVELADDGLTAYSSSAIRRMLTSGNVAEAACCLSRPYTLSGRVEQGEHIGHRLGFPTANLHPDDSRKLIPAPGVYAVTATLSGEPTPRAAMMNIGTRPTFDGTRQTLEVHILDFAGDLYGQTVTVAFVDRLRPEQRFETAEALASQLERDRDAAKRVLGLLTEEQATD